MFRMKVVVYIIKIQNYVVKTFILNISFFRTSLIFIYIYLFAFSIPGFMVYSTVSCRQLGTISHLAMIGVCKTV